jgi:hypothetical protein
LVRHKSFDDLIAKAEAVIDKQTCEDYFSSLGRICRGFSVVCCARPGQQQCEAGSALVRAAFERRWTELKYICEPIYR